ncbi:MAG: hypothetical protein AAF804_17110 [Bacteroidota bacterium]
MSKHSFLTYSILIGWWVLSACQEQPAAVNQSQVVANWTLVDSLVLESNPADTLFEGWPYYGDSSFYVVSFLHDFKARRYDLEGNKRSIIGKGRGKGPGELLFLQALGVVDSLVGLFDVLSQSLMLYDTSGEPLRPIKFESTDPASGKAYSINADNRIFNYYQGKFYSLVGYLKTSHRKPEYYEYPFLSIHDRTGKLLRVVGERDSAYHEKLMAYQYKVSISIDSFAERILVSQPVSHTWETYDLEGNFVARYGEPGSYIADQTWEGISFEGNPQTPEQRRQFIDLIFQSPKYHHLTALPSGHVIRSYSRGVGDYEGMMNFLDKPHFLQIYDAGGKLISDAPAPDFYFMPVAVMDGDLWVNLARSYDPETYRYTLYRCRLEIQGWK